MWPIRVTSSGGATGHLSPTWRGVRACVCTRVCGGAGVDTELLPIPASRPDPRLPESWRQPAPFSGRARLPRGPGSGWGGGRGLDDPGPQRPGLSRPLRQIAADRRAVSLESPPARRLPPDPITPRRVGPSGWEGVGGRGESRRPDLFSARAVAPALLQERQRGHFFPVRSREVPGQAACVAQSPVLQANAKTRPLLAAQVPDLPGL